MLAFLFRMRMDLASGNRSLFRFRTWGGESLRHASGTTYHKPRRNAANLCFSAFCELGCRYPKKLYLLRSPSPGMATRAATICGIYFIFCAANGGIYIGSSQDVSHRIGRHLYALRADKHSNVHLQRAYHKHGAESFVFGLLESVSDKSDLLQREQVWLDSGVATFNIAKDATAPMRGLAPSIETRAKLSAALRGRTRSPESIAKTAAGLRGRKLSPEHIAKTAAANKGRVLSAEHRAKISFSNTGRVLDAGQRAAQLLRAQMPSRRAKISATLTGRKASSETRAKLSAALTGKSKSAEHCANLSAARTGLKQSPETVAKRSAAIRAQASRHSFEGAMLTVTEISERTGLLRSTIHYRILAGIPIRAPRGTRAG